MGFIFTILIGVIFAMFFYSMSIYRDLHNIKVLLRGAESDRDRFAKNSADSSRLKERSIEELKKKVANKDEEIKKYLGAMERGVTVDEYVREEKEAEKIRQHQEVIRKKIAEDRLQKEREAQERSRRHQERSNYSRGHSRGYSGGRSSGRSSSGLYGYMNDSSYGGSSSSSCDSSSSSDSSSCGGGSD